jgi:hypothetical protein
MLLQYNGKDPFMLFECWADLPASYPEIEKDNYISTKYPNQFQSFYLESQSEQRNGMEVYTPNGLENLTPMGFDPLEVCHYATYQTEYNSTRLALRDAMEMHCNSREEAINLRQRSLDEEGDLEDRFPENGRHIHIVKGIEETMIAIENKFIGHLCRFFGGLIQIRVSAECVNAMLWFTRCFGEVDPCGRPQARDRYAPFGSNNVAFLPGFDYSLEDQIARYDMTRISAFHHRSQILTVNLFISLDIVTTSYNEIMTLYSTQFSKLVRDF